MPHLNNKQNKNTNPIISRQDYHHTQACPSEEKQINKSSAQILPYMKLTQTTGPTLGGQKPKGRKNSTFFRERIQFSLKPGKCVSAFAQSCPTLCDPVDCSLPGFSFHGILQAKILERIAISFSRGSSRPRDRTQVFCIAGRRFTI